MEDVLKLHIQVFENCSEWFTKILDAVEGGKFYIAIVFIVMTIGFLLSNFRVAMFVGSDFANVGSDIARNVKGRYSPGNNKAKTAHGRYQKGYIRSDIVRRNKRS